MIIIINNNEKTLSTRYDHMADFHMRSHHVFSVRLFHQCVPSSKQNRFTEPSCITVLHNRFVTVFVIFVLAGCFANLGDRYWPLGAAAHSARAAYPARRGKNKTAKQNKQKSACVSFKHLNLVFYPD